MTKLGCEGSFGGFLLGVNLTSPLFAEPATIDGLPVRQSMPPGARIGLFATKKLILNYHGDLISREDSLKM